MDCLGTRATCRVDELVRAQVALARRSGADVDRLVGFPCMRSGGVRIAEHGHGADPELPARPHDAKRDLTAIRDENLIEH
jgi:hypothetical protein